eukprot:438892_1
MTDHSGSLHWEFSGASLTKFLAASNGAEFASETFNAGRFTFQCKVYPNGRKSCQKGCVMLYFILQTSFTKKINQITVKARLYCPQTLCDWKHIQHLKRDNAGIGWHSQNMLLQEAKPHSHIKFVCDIDVVRIEYKPSSKHSHKSINIGHNIYHKLSQMNVYTRYDWNIHPKLLQSFQASHNGKFYHSPDYNHGSWCTSIAPNGANRKDIGNVKVGLQLLLLPPGVTKIKTRFSIACNYDNIKCEGKREFHYSSTFIAWGDGTMKSTALQQQHMDGLSFVVEIIILQMYDECNQEIHKSNWFQFGIINNLMMTPLSQSDQAKTIHSSDPSNYNLLSPSITQISVAPNNAMDEEKAHQHMVRPKLNNNTYSMDIHTNKASIDSQKHAIHELHSKLDDIEIYKTEDEKHLMSMEKTIISLQKSQHRLQQEQFEQTAVLKQHMNDMSMSIQRLTNEVVFMKNKVKKIENEQLKLTAEYSARSPRSHSHRSSSSKSSKKHNKSRKKEDKIVQISSGLATWIKEECGFPQYVVVFAENGYDNFEIVKEMTRFELQDIGIKLKGHQFKIIKEIEKLVQTQKHHRAKDTMDIVHVAQYLTPVASPAGSDSASPKHISRPPSSPTNDTTYSHSKLLLTNMHSQSRTHPTPRFLNFGAPINISPSRSASYTSTTQTNGYMQWTKHQKPSMLLESPSSMNNVWNTHHYSYRHSPKRRPLHLRPQISKMWECKACHNSNEGTLDKCEFCQHPRAYVVLPL